MVSAIRWYKLLKRRQNGRWPHRRLCVDKSCVHGCVAKPMEFDKNNRLSSTRKSRRRWCAHLPRTDNDRVEMLHRSGLRHPSTWTLPSFAASSDVLPSWRATM
jgi:hypothetical protein